MANARIPVMRSQTAVGLLVFVAAVWLAWETGRTIPSGNLRALEIASLDLIVLSPSGRQPNIIQNLLALLLRLRIPGCPEYSCCLGWGTPECGSTCRTQ